MDPFLQKKYGIGRDYLADIHRTYNRNIPTDTFDRALKYREEERRRVDALVAENELLRKKEEYRASWDNDLNVLFSNFTSKLSKIKSSNGSSTDRRNDGSTPRPSPHVSSSERESGRVVDSGVPGEVLPSDSVRDSSGQGREHTDEGRQSGVDDTVSSGSASGGVQEE